MDEESEDDLKTPQHKSSNNLATHMMPIVAVTPACSTDVKRKGGKGKSKRYEVDGRIYSLRHNNNKATPTKRLYDGMLLCVAISAHDEFDYLQCSITSLVICFCLVVVTSDFAL